MLLGLKCMSTGLKVRDDSFCIFIFYGKQLKSRVLKEWAELVASQLTQNY
jgi:hypothetical protein